MQTQHKVRRWPHIIMGTITGPGDAPLDIPMEELQLYKFFIECLNSNEPYQVSWMKALKHPYLKK